MAKAYQSLTLLASSVILFAMSLPLGLRNWISCPYCNECQDIKRLGLIGMRGIPDSKRFKCGFCGKTFTSEGGTMLENMGRDSEGNYPFRDA